MTPFKKDHIEGNRFFEPLQFNKELIALCRRKGVDAALISDAEWNELYTMAKEDYDYALSEGHFYAWSKSDD